MSVIRVRFVRGEDVKYISHLDLMKTFERALRRAKLPIAYSQGFNPHPQMVFGLPLPVGVTSEAEYADFELTEETEPGKFKDILNKQLPAGLSIIEARTGPDKSNIMASVTGASYKVLACTAYSLNTETGESLCEEETAADIYTDRIENKLEEFLERSEITVRKETKNNVKMIDIRPMIKDFTLEFDSSENMLNAQSGSINPFIRDYVHILDQTAAYNTECKGGALMCFNMTLSAGSAANLKPELLLAAFASFCKKALHIVKVHRTGLFTGNEEGFLSVG